jgi:Cu-Zn family superoxide dismutase
LFDWSFFMLKKLAVSVSLSVLPLCSFALNFDVNTVDSHGVGPAIGTVKVVDLGDAGVRFDVKLKHKQLSGIHGFHLHENPSCDPLAKNGQMVPALAAGSHFDPHHTGLHKGPEGDGHLGDLPALVADRSGVVNMSVVAKRLKLSDVMNRSLIVHAGPDNYADKTGGARFACAVTR